jgi:hypothetical protein
MKKQKNQAQFTPFPNRLIDEVMPQLRDTEWRILCVIARQTLGWKDPKTGKRKQSDWLTQRQLKRRTGRESEAICNALDALVSKRLVDVRTSEGQPLRTPADRRRHIGRLHFRLTTV